VVPLLPGCVARRGERSSRPQKRNRCLFGAPHPVTTVAPYSVGSDVLVITEQFVGSYWAWASSDVIPRRGLPLARFDPSSVFETIRLASSIWVGKGSIVSDARASNDIRVVYGDQSSKDHELRPDPSPLPSGLTQTFDQVGVVLRPKPRTRLRTYMLNAAGAAEMALSSHSFASEVRPSWPRAAAGQR
jgi:hypothetical protein